MSVLIGDHCLSDLRPLVLEWFSENEDAAAALEGSVFGNEAMEKELVRGLRKVLKSVDLHGIGETKEASEEAKDRIRIWKLLKRLQTLWTVGNNRSLVPSLLDCLVKSIIISFNPELLPGTLEEMQVALETELETQQDQENSDMQLTSEQSRTLPLLSSALQYLLERPEEFGELSNLSRVFFSTRLELRSSEASSNSRGSTIQKEPSIKLLSTTLSRALTRSVANRAISEWSKRAEVPEAERIKREAFLTDAIDTILVSS